MGGMQFDREIFTAHKDPPPPSSSPTGPLVLLGVVALLALGVFAIYEFAKRGGGFGAGGSSDVAAIVEKLDEIEERLDQLESRRSRRSRAASTAAPDRESGKSKSGSPKPAPKTANRISSPAGPQPTATSPSAPPQDTSLASRPVGSAAPPQGPDPADAEQWKATADRLGTVVGELGSQRGEIARNREELMLLMDRFQGTDIAFALQKKRGRQRVGPVSLRLERADTKNQRYTMRLLADDKTILLKDRALNEGVRFYIQGVTEPPELVVSEIGKNQVAGKLVLPKTETTR